METPKLQDEPGLGVGLAFDPFPSAGDVVAQDSEESRRNPQVLVQGLFAAGYDGHAFRGTNSAQQIVIAVRPAFPDRRLGVVHELLEPLLG